MHARRGGFVRFLVLPLLLLAAYTAVTFVPVQLTVRRVERVVARGLDDWSYRLEDRSIRDKLVRKAASAGIELARDAIDIRREAEPGERIVHVDLAYPIVVDYLGAERTLSYTLSIEHAVEVDEHAERRRLALEREAAAWRASRPVPQDERSAAYREAMAMCAEIYGADVCREAGRSGFANWLRDQAR